MVQLAPAHVQHPRRLSAVPQAVCSQGSSQSLSPLSHPGLQLQHLMAAPLIGTGLL